MKTQAHRPIVVKGPYPTADEVAAEFGLSRQERRQVDEIMEKHFQQEEKAATKPERRSHRRTSAKVPRRGQ